MYRWLSHVFHAGVTKAIPGPNMLLYVNAQLINPPPYGTNAPSVGLELLTSHYEGCLCAIIMPTTLECPLGMLT